MSRLDPATSPPGLGLRLRCGHPLPLGVSETRQGFNFALFSRHATAATLVLYASGNHIPLHELRLDPAENRTGDIWHIAIDGLDPDTRYTWRVDRQPVRRDRLHCFDPMRDLIDPYARALTSGHRWGGRDRRRDEPPRTEYSLRRSLHVDGDFDWESVRRPQIHLADKIIYEAHVRGFTRHSSAAVAHPGTYDGLIEKIPYLKDLGVTTVELLPVYEFDENEVKCRNPFTGEYLKNFWGYSPICFFAPKAAYAANGRDGNQVRTFRTLVRELHRAGIEVFLDVVFNHTAEGEGDADDPTFSFRGLDNSVYYLVDPETGRYRDFSGCGNTLNCNHPVVRTLIIDALRYWVTEMHIDGFRFDLASVLGRGQNGEVLANPPILERIAFDPVLSRTTLIAEAWDAAGLWQVGTFPAWGRWAEWNSLFRDDVRRFVRGEAGLTGAIATRLAGSADLYERSGREPCHSINFVTCHDGFTLADLVSYERKHNEMNGEENRDGVAESLSANYGVEGPTEDAAINAMRRRQQKNFLTLLLLAQGTPMLLGGDELGRTQQGNNNAYSQDNEVSWIDWRMLQRNGELYRFVKLLLAFRLAHPVLRRRSFLSGRGTDAAPQPDVTWHGTELGKPDWGPDSRRLAMHLAGVHAPAPDCDVYLAINASMEPCVFALPRSPDGGPWLRVLDTGRPSPDDIAEAGFEPPFVGEHVPLEGRSCVVLRST